MCAHARMFISSPDCCCVNTVVCFVFNYPTHPHLPNRTNHRRASCVVLESICQAVRASLPTKQGSRQQTMSTGRAWQPRRLKWTFDVPFRPAHVLVPQVLGLPWGGHKTRVTCSTNVTRPSVCSCLLPLFLWKTSNLLVCRHLSILETYYGIPCVLILNIDN